MLKCQSRSYLSLRNNFSVRNLAIYATVCRWLPPPSQPTLRSVHSVAMKSLSAGLVIGSARQRAPLEFHKLLFSKVFASFLMSILRPVPVSQNEPDFAAAKSQSFANITSQWGGYGCRGEIRVFVLRVLIVPDAPESNYHDTAHPERRSANRAFPLRVRSRYNPLSHDRSQHADTRLVQLSIS